MIKYLCMASILLASTGAYAQEKSYYSIPKDVKCMVKKSNKITYCNDLNGNPITGEMRRYYNGDLKHSYMLENGILEGASITYYRDRSVKTEKIYKNGMLNGITTEYYKNGNPKEEASYVNGKQEGITKQYYEEGGLMSQAVYQNDKINGEYHIYDKSQQLIYNFKSINSALKSGTYYYKTEKQQTKSSEIPEVIIKAIGHKCAQIHMSSSDNPCATNDYQEKCNWKWYNKNKTKIDDYYTTCSQSQQQE